MQFEPTKSELIHFTRAHAAPSQSVQLGGATVQPTESARFLGVWLNRKLRWTAHLKQIKKKCETQIYALTRITASAWGCRLAQAREIYTKVIRSAIAYGAEAYHQPTTGQRPKGLARSLNAIQARCLRIVAGAYRATAVRHLETETNTPPLDLYLNTRLAGFEQRLQASRTGELIRTACATIARRLRNRRARPSAARQDPNSGESQRVWADQWLGTDLAQTAVTRDWKARCIQSAQGARAQRPHRLATPADQAILGPKALRKHQGLRKHESSVLTQIRTGKIGLRAFLFQARVPDVATPLCRCGNEPETPTHVILRCPELSEEREQLRSRVARPLHTYRDLVEATESPGTARILVRWLLNTGRLPEFRLATKLTREEGGAREQHGSY